MNGFTLSKWIIFLGLTLVGIGLIIWIVNKIGIPVGKLPGDIVIKKEKFKIYFPIATSILISIVLTIIFNLIRYLKK